MNRFVWARSGMAAAVALVVAAGGHVGVANAADDELALKMASSVRNRVFVRAGAIYAKVKTKSGDTYDVTGPVITRADLQNLLDQERINLDQSDPQPSIIASIVQLSPAQQLLTPDVQDTIKRGVANALITGTANIDQLIELMTNGTDRIAPNQPGDTGDEVTALGTPAGIKGKAAESISTAGFSLGYFLDDEYKWTVEAYVLAKPVSTTITASGNSQQRINSDDAFYSRPFGLQGQKILSTKMLPPLVILGRYWGDKQNRFRPYTGVMAMYAMFYDTKATDALNSFVGGGNPGDTTVSIKNKFGIGPVLGLKYQFNDDWHLNLNVGSVKLKTQATLVTRNTMITKDTGAIQEYGRTVFSSEDPLAAEKSISDFLLYAENLYSRQTNRTNIAINASGGVTGVASRAVAAMKGNSNLGTFVRKTDTTLTATTFMLSVGRSF